MTNRPKAIGTATESAVVAYLRTDGFPHAERRALAGFTDLGDITGTPLVVWEVKGGHAAETASDAQIRAWLQETERERANARADIGILITKRKAIGAQRAGHWWAHMTLGTVLDLSGKPTSEIDPDIMHVPVRLLLVDAVHLLRAAGYGDPVVLRRPAEEEVA